MESVALDCLESEVFGTAGVVVLTEEEFFLEGGSYVSPAEGIFSTAADVGLSGGIDITLALMPPARSRTSLKRTPSNRHQIERALSRIEASVPMLMSQGADQAGFLLALSAVVVESLGHLSPADDDWVVARLGAILAMHGIR